MQSQEELTTQIENLTAEEMGERIRNFAGETLTVLKARQKAEAACPTIEVEHAALRVESADLESKNLSLTQRLSSAERLARFASDELAVWGESARAQATLAELEELKAESAKLAGRKREIAERCGQLESEKEAVLRRASERFRDDSIVVIRGAESALAGILDESRDTLNSLETRLGVPLYQPEQLTAAEKSPEWITLNRLYRGAAR